MFAEIAPLTGAKKIDTLTYKIPQRLKYKVRVGKFVSVPLQNRKVIGVVLGHPQKSKIQNLKTIQNIIKKPALTKTQIKLALWLSEYYFTPLGGSFKFFIQKEPQIKHQTKNPHLKPQKIKNLPPLTKNQKKVWESITKSQLLNQAYLIYDQSGYSRWKIYLHLIDWVLRNKKQALFLVPEINLVPSLVRKFAPYFPKQIIIAYSRLSKTQNQAVIDKLKRKKPLLIIASRKALFYPYRNLGLIIVEEEDNLFYKQNMAPRYHTPILASKLAEALKAKMVMSSPTPTIESYFKAKNGEYFLLETPKKITFKKPQIKISNLRKKKKQEIFNKEIILEIQKNLQRKQKIIILTQRKGFSAIACDECNKLLKCPYCQSTLILHQKEFPKPQLICHLCKTKIKAPKICPGCQSHKLNYISSGTQRIEKEIKKLFPKIKIITLDSDMIKTESERRLVSKKIRKERPDVIIGTRLLSSISLPKANLLIINSPEFILNFPDIKSSEMLFAQIVKSAIKLSKRKGGKVIIATYNPKNKIILAASQYNYEQFYKDEIQERRELKYPPFMRIIKLTYQNKSKKLGIETIKETQQKLEKLGYETIGPGPCFMAKSKRKYCWILIVKLPIGEKNQKIAKFLKDLPRNWIIDPDPITVL